VAGLRSPLALLAAVSVLLAGCTSTTRLSPGATLQVALTEYRVRPQSVSAPAGSLTIEVHNFGRLSHDLVISLNGRTEFSTRPIPPGQSTQLYAALSPGKYLMASTVLSDQALGAYGTLTITR
jgi:hypothetical protein